MSEHKCRVCDLPAPYYYPDRVDLGYDCNGIRRFMDGIYRTCCDKHAPFGAKLVAECPPTSHLGVVASEPTTVRVNWADLKRTKVDGVASVCPVCKEGVLCVTRHPDTYAILPRDSCTLCGQIFIYEDVAKIVERAGW